MIKLFETEIKNENDILIISDKMEVLNDIWGLIEADFSKLASTALEFAYYLTDNKLNAKLSLNVNSSIKSIIDVIITIEVKNKKNIPTYYLQKLDSWVRSLRGKLDIKETKNKYTFSAIFRNININIYLDDLAIKELQESLNNSDLKLLTNLSRDELIIGLKERSSKLQQTMDNLIELEQKSEEIELLNQQLANTNLELKSSIEKVKEADRMKSQFLANMSHELRTPLNSIIGFSQLLNDQLIGELSPEQNDIINDILGSATHLLGLINQILDISKIEAGMMEIKTREVSINDLIKEVKSQVAPLLSAKKLELIITNNGIKKINCDDIRIKQVLINLLSNAIKFSKDNNQIIINITPENKYAKLSVKDHGIGIKEEHQKMVFEEFKQVDDSHTRQYQGTGLGLALCKKLVELHQGKIWVESKYGEGSEFFFTIPL